MSNENVSARNEKGSASLKFLLVLVVLGAIFHAGYIYAPVAYNGEDFKQRMKEIVVNATAMPTASANSLDGVKDQLRRAANSKDVPLNAVINVTRTNGVVQASVNYQKDLQLLPFGLYKYTYKFSHTANGLNMFDEKAQTGKTAQ